MKKKKKLAKGSVITVPVTTNILGFSHDWDIFTDNNEPTFTPNKKMYMVYGSDCKNKSELLFTEKDLKEKIKFYGNDDSWTGHVVGYELKPIYRAKKNIKVEKIKGVK